jgi:ABC-type nitrate/sulfonate/bicarbonate transport system permease component
MAASWRRSPRVWRAGAQGYLIAALAGIGLGTLAGYHPVVRQAIEPIVDLVRPLPSPAIIPVAILFLGIGAAMKIFIVAWACFFPILLNTYGWGARGADAARRDRTQSGARLLPHAP